MKELLASWSVDVLFQGLDEYGFDIKSLENIDDNDLTMIFNEKKFYAPVKRFKQQRALWIKKKVLAYPNFSFCDADCRSNTLPMLRSVTVTFQNLTNESVTLHQNSPHDKDNESDSSIPDNGIYNQL